LIYRSYLHVVDVASRHVSEADAIWAVEEILSLVLHLILVAVDGLDAASGAA
jgi:hypothetical protein